MIYACKTSSAHLITVIMPYYPYSKQCRLRRRSAIPCKLLAEMICDAGGLLYGDGGDGNDVIFRREPSHHDGPVQEGNSGLFLHSRGQPTGVAVSPALHQGKREMKLEYCTNHQ